MEMVTLWNKFVWKQLFNARMMIVVLVIVRILIIMLTMGPVRHLRMECLMRMNRMTVLGHFSRSFSL